MTKVWEAKARSSPAVEVYEKRLAKIWQEIGCAAEGHLTCFADCSIIWRAGFLFFLANKGRSCPRSQLPSSTKSIAPAHMGLSTQKRQSSKKSAIALSCLRQNSDPIWTSCAGLASFDLCARSLG